ncbi:uncharacterized protein LOC117111297 [Anneissia japonica]|uniref:uncharacterized protein LOC117111297 n=1 Tax=Anneissia japonica TaxID=1529436 RepID=UPI001425649B|nr:uncharacterized protein LOC117111297 [Anneissia japonica]
MAFNTTGSLTSLWSNSAQLLCIATTAKDVEVRQGCAWTAANKLVKIWKSSLSRSLQIKFFKATVETHVLLYGAESWTLNKTLEKRLVGCYTRFLHHALNISWRQHINRQLYGELPKITSVISDRRLRFAGHCHRAKEEIIRDVLF